MPVCPDWLDRITPDAGQLDQLKRIRRIRLFWVFIKIAQAVLFALAARAGARAPQLFQQHVILRAIIPFHRQFFADGLNVQRSHMLEAYFLAAPASTHSDFIDSPAGAGNLLFVED